MSTTTPQKVSSNTPWKDLNRTLSSSQDPSQDEALFDKEEALGLSISGLFAKDELPLRALIVKRLAKLEWWDNPGSQAEKALLISSLSDWDVWNHNCKEGLLTYLQETS